MVALVVQRIGCKLAEFVIEVRFLTGAQFFKIQSKLIASPETVPHALPLVNVGVKPRAHLRDELHQSKQR